MLHRSWQDQRGATLSVRVTSRWEAERVLDQLPMLLGDAAVTWWWVRHQPADAGPPVPPAQPTGHRGHRPCADRARPAVPV